MKNLPEPKLEKLIEKLSLLRHPVVVTQNKKPAASENFTATDGARSIHHNGFWISRPPQATKISAGVHFQKSRRGEPNLVWSGKWLEPERETESPRWSFRLSHVEGPYETYSSFDELFGVHAQASFVYMRKRPSAAKLAAMGEASVQVHRQLEALLNKLAKVPLTGDDVSVLAKRRLGHGQLREAVHALFDSTCCLTGITTRSLLVCSHIKPWSVCNPREKVSHHNTLLLAANWDAAFDKRLISFDDDGSVIRSAAIKPLDAARLGLDLGLKLPEHLLSNERREFLKHHRAQLIKRV